MVTVVWIIYKLLILFAVLYVCMYVLSNDVLTVLYTNGVLYRYIYIYIGCVCGVVLLAYLGKGLSNKYKSFCLLKMVYHI